MNIKNDEQKLALIFTYLHWRWLFFMFLEILPGKTESFNAASEF